MIKKDFIKNAYGMILGKIEEDERGNKTIKNQYGRILGRYNASDDTTRDEYGYILYRGDRLSLLLR